MRRSAQMLEELLSPIPDARRGPSRAHAGDGYRDSGALRALSGRFIAPVPGGDLIRSPEILPTGRNIHAFDPFRMPTAFALPTVRRRRSGCWTPIPACRDRGAGAVGVGQHQVRRRPDRAGAGADGRAAAVRQLRPPVGADLIPLAELGRPRIDVVMTLSGIFRDLLPLQTRMLAEAAWKAATADEPAVAELHPRPCAGLCRGDGRGHGDRRAARVFERRRRLRVERQHAGRSSAFGDEDELADAYEARKSFAYGRNGKAVKKPQLLQKALKDVDLAYQNLESVELGVTSVDHYFDTLGGIARAVPARARGG
jgi:magnesium chelatase subunit H